VEEEEEEEAGDDKSEEGARWTVEWGGSCAGIDAGVSVEMGEGTSHKYTFPSAQMAVNGVALTGKRKQKRGKVLRRREKRGNQTVVLEEIVLGGQQSRERIWEGAVS
jgi:hypothetical protein